LLKLLISSFSSSVEEIIKAIEKINPKTSGEEGLEI
jgi:hypothetical protein